MRHLDELGARPVGADEDHRLRLCATDHLQGRADGARVSLEGAFGRKLQAPAVEMGLHARQHVAPERVILIEDRDPRQAELFREMLDRGFGLRGVAGADVHDVLEVRCPQELRAGDRADEGHVVGSGDRRCRDRGRCAHGADQREHLVLVDQLDGLHHRSIGIVAVVAAGQLESSAIDAAFCVELVEGGQQALPRRLT